MANGTILDTILEHKAGEVAERKTRTPLQELQAAAADLPPTRGFREALRSSVGQSQSPPPAPPVPEGVKTDEMLATGRSLSSLRGSRGHTFSAATMSGRTPALIAEVKKASPTAGIIRDDFDPVSIAQVYDRHGASCLSVLTDERFFQGHDSYLLQIREAVKIPLLRKDFTIDPYQIFEARVLGADAILLIVSALSPEDIIEMIATARALGLDALVEVHTEDEMHVAVDAQADLIGINSRDLRTFKTDLGTVHRLAALAPPHALLVAESGIKTSRDVAQVADSGAHAILVGETLMRSPDIGEAVDRLYCDFRQQASQTID